MFDGFSAKRPIIVYRALWYWSQTPPSLSYRRLHNRIRSQLPLPAGYILKVRQTVRMVCCRQEAPVSETAPRLTRPALIIINAAQLYFIYFVL